MSRDYNLQPFRPPVELQIDYARELNPQQLAAVTAAPGPSLVIAGAGSGKTRTLTYRVAWLIEHGIPAERILLLTFTNKAAKEMMRRCSDLLNNDISRLWGGTFHSVGNRILRRHADVLGWRSDFTILDREDAEDLVKACMDAAEIDVKAARFPKADVLGDIFSMAVNTNRSIAEVIGQDYDYFAALTPQIEDIARRYQARKQATNGMDFDDLLTQWLRLLREFADLREIYQRRFEFILVDEYQDTNKLQGELIDLLAARHKNLMVVGDDAQSIYAWRGANFKNILDFPQRYFNCAVYRIETNYRSTPEILALANAAIAANVQQFAKQLAPARKSGVKPALVVCGDAHEQAAFVAQRALELRDEGFALNDMAVLYRSHFHALEMQLELTRRNIPFSITSGIRFFEQAHVKDVSAYLRLVTNPHDELAFKRVVRMLPGIGGKGADKLWQNFSAGFQAKYPNWREEAPQPMGGAENDDPDWSVDEVASGGPLTPALSPSEGARENTAPSLGNADAMKLAPRIETHDSQPARSAIPPRPLGGGEGRGEGEPRVQIAPILQSCSKSVPKKTAVAWAQFTATVSQLEAPELARKPGEMIQLIVEAGYEDYLKETFTNYRNRLEDLEELAGFAQRFATTAEFLTQLALLTNVEAEDNQAASNDDERLKLSTIHQAKGLEFRVVFVIMLCDGLFPSARSLDNIEGEEEERRLFYVAITRAKDELYLTHPLVRMTFGGSGDSFQQPSRFLKEIPAELREEWNLRPHAPYG